jgi:hypothetical protein
MKLKTIVFLEPGNNGLQKRKVSFITEEEFTEFLRLGNGRTLAKVPLDTTEEAITEVLLTLEDAVVAATDTDSFLLLESPFKMASAEDMKAIITSLTKIRARAIVMNTTRYIFSDPVVKDNYGDLQLINHGESVQFYLKGHSKPTLECCGLIKTTSASALLNEVKVSPKMEDVDDVLECASTLSSILQKHKFFVSHPPQVLEELNGVQRVVPFLSGRDFSREVINKCSLLGVNTVETNGSDYSVSVRLHLPSD